jgi:hypothetical protein
MTKLHSPPDFYHKNESPSAIWNKSAHLALKDLFL